MNDNPAQAHYTLSAANHYTSKRRIVTRLYTPFAPPRPCVNIFYKRAGILKIERLTREVSSNTWISN